ncbi:MAG: hypothetical protein AB7O21_17325 [Gammaproteobacteria bacterium]
MDTWMKVASAIALATMLVLLFPHARRMMTQSPAAERGDWRAALLPIAGVVLFVIFLMSVV